MRVVPLSAVFLACLWWIAPACGQAGKDAPKDAIKVSAEEIERLVEQLGDRAFAKREKARTRLEEIGEPAIGALKKAANNTEILEVRNAARAIIEAHDGPVLSLAVSTDGRLLASGSADGTMRICQLTK